MTKTEPLAALVARLDELKDALEQIEARMLILERAEKGEGLDLVPNATEIGCAKEDLADEIMDHWPLIYDTLRQALSPVRDGGLRERLRPVLVDILNRPMPSTVEFEEMLDSVLATLPPERGELEGAYRKAIDMLEDQYAGSWYSFDIREDLIEAFAASGRDIPGDHSEGLPKNATELASYRERENG